MKAAAQPFQFVTASYLTRIENQRAWNLAELTSCLDQASDAAVFYHTFQTLSRHHFLTEGFSNDFAQWVLASCNSPRLFTTDPPCSVTAITSASWVCRGNSCVVKSACIRLRPVKCRSHQ